MTLQSQGTVFRVVWDYVPLVVLGRQRDLGDALCSDIVLSGSQYVKFCLVRRSVEKTFLVSSSEQFSPQPFSHPYIF